MSGDLPSWVFKNNSLTPTERLKFYGPDAASPSMILKGPSYDPRAHYLRVKALYDEYPYKTEKACDEHMIGVVKLIFQKKRFPNETIVNAVGTVVYEVLSKEGIYEPGRPYLPEKPETYTYLQRRFNEQEVFFSSYKERLEKLVTELIKIFSDYLSVLPDGAYVENANVSTFPLLYAFNPPLRLAHTVFHTLTTAEKDGKPVFPNVSDKLYDNLIAVSGQTREKLNPDRLKFVIDYDGDPVEAVSRYFAGTNLGDLCMAPIAFAIPQETRFAGHWIIAPPGRGKTTLLHTMIMEDLQKDACVILMDSKGDLINPIRKLKSIKDRLVIIDPHNWPAPGSEDTELGVLMEPEVGHGETEVYARVQA